MNDTFRFDPKNTQRFEFGFITDENHPDFDAVYDCYKKCFPLPTEQESKENFLAILEENKDKSKPGQEMWVYIKDKQTGEVLGADNFDAFVAAEGYDINGTCQDIYMFVDEKYRQQGVYSKLIDLREQATAEYLKDQGIIQDTHEAKICTFAEQNNALMMTPAQYIEDTEAAIDQCVRRSIFERPIKIGDDHTEGFRTIQMRYVQPALEAGGEICDYLDYVVKMPDNSTTIPAAIVKGHLNKFFEKSFPEGTSLEDPTLKGMKCDLETLKDIPLEPTGKFDTLGKHLNVDVLKELPKKQQEQRIGAILPELVEAHYGEGVTLDHAMESYTSIRSATGHTKGLAAPGGRHANDALRSSIPLY